MLTGSNFIGSRESREGPGGFRAQDPSTGEVLEPAFAGATPAEVDAAARVPQAASEAYAALPPMRRAAFLRAIAEQLVGLGDAPDGVFSMVHGPSPAVGQALATHPSVQAVGFTGSFRGGRALFDAAARREQPIPVFVLPDALATRGEEIAKALAEPEELRGPNPRGIWRLVDGRLTREAL